VNRSCLFAATRTGISLLPFFCRRYFWSMRSVSWRYPAAFLSCSSPSASAEASTTKITPRSLDLEFWDPRLFDRRARPWDSRSLPWPGVSVSWYLIAVRDVSPRVGSLTERKRLEPIGMVRGRVIEVEVDVWEVCVCRGCFKREVDFCSSWAQG
jgi:hypothetical protein